MDMTLTEKRPGFWKWYLGFLMNAILSHWGLYKTAIALVGLIGIVLGMVPANWFPIHNAGWLDILRVCLGVAIFLSGILLGPLYYAFLKFREVEENRDDKIREMEESIDKLQAETKSLKTPEL